MAVLVGADTLPAGLRPLAELLRGKAAGSAFIRWAILDTVETYLTALCWRLDDEAAEEIGRRLSARFDEWGARLPLTNVWRRLSTYTIGEELRLLRGQLLPAPSARARFARRLRAHLHDQLPDRPTFNAVLESNGYTWRGRRHE